jgi:arylamine N-acetyltransferase
MISPVAGADVPQQWVRRYLNLLEVERAAPSLEALTDLTKAHIVTIAFENVTSMRRRAAHSFGPVPPWDPDELLANWEQGRGGGVCFELAPMFGRLLRALGYNATPVLGQITFPGSHQAVLVELDTGRYLVDVSNGAPFFAPIPLDRTVEVNHVGLAYRFRPGESSEEWFQERSIHGAWEPFCRYDLRPAGEHDADVAYQRHHTPGESWVVDKIRLIRCREDAVISLFGDELVRFTDTGKQTERVGDPARLAELVRDVFLLPEMRLPETLGKV